MRAGLLILVLLCGCSARDTDRDASGHAGAGAGNNKPRVALIMKSLANEFFSTMADGATTHQREHAEQYDLVVNGIKDERDLSRQVELVQEMVASGVNAIVIAPADSKALIPALRRAMAAGIVVINIDNKLDEKMLKSEGLSIPFVGPDNRAGAQAVGDYLAGKLTPGDAVCILEGLQTSENGQQRKAGFETAMNEAGMKIVDSQSAEWEMSKANTIASSMLSEHPEIKAILAANDSMAMGAIAATKSVGRAGDVLIVGFDNIAAVQEAIRGGKILATADQHGDQLAVFGIEAALNSLSDAETELKNVETPVDLVTAESLANDSASEEL
ncbi:sugar ABC transporter substrate-binding protein [Allorhodopirellula heiligendammensis]|uniref:D-ribose-binding periplasmic protein n=1 Tax=Allorhodopirellula heiligendammensis TaxID=2714739 RepID=A0A5C6C4C3_9BACT|nr:sugar ABC transporter substrate-binding protein [Allorhodopirellula heiligendammensis]TWU19450.1 D-ribose-binding periplasmic protein precursor [Allorhodopirellula heiligendammensis]